MDVILLSDKFFCGDHKSVQASHNPKGRRYADTEAPRSRMTSTTAPHGAGRGERGAKEAGAHKYCSFSSVSIVNVRGSP